MKLLIHIIVLVVFVSTSNPTNINLRDDIEPSYALRPPKKPRTGNDKNSQKEDADDDLEKYSGAELDPYDSKDKRFKENPRPFPIPKNKRIRKKVPLDDDNEKLTNNQILRDILNVQKALSETKVLRNGDQFKNKYTDFSELPGKQAYHMDPVLNLVRRGNAGKLLNARRRNKNKDKDDDDSDSDDSDSTDLDKNWKDEWVNFWNIKKKEAINATMPVGDNVRMVGARPWGVHCGDPNQHDMPWGSCMLAMECEPEYRIYRGDLFCGRTEFVCCGIYLTNYDLYQGIDVSFDDKSLSTDSEEKQRAGKSDEKGKKKKTKEKGRRRKERIKRKEKIKKNIRKIIREITKILEDQYKNGTRQRVRKTKMLKKFVKHLKKQYKKDRNSMKELHEEAIMKIDRALMLKLNQIMAMNHEFVKNETFRSIIVNGTITKTGARMLVEAYPELASYIHFRRSFEPIELPVLRDKSSVEDYDVEYGYLYY